MKIKLKIIKRHFEDLEARKSDLEKLILTLAVTYTEQINLILTVPDFHNIFSAIGVVSEIGVNMDAFPSDMHLCSCAGLTPTNNERLNL